ncbi:phage regulatory CII family protein [Pseudomonas sichuanensis]|uniref:phage regulatory CII family protein n=1 Tax=Pseudomonas sichuanensis TaxID=2213015 RepID=UPI000DA6788B|nr:phage regulatory CII family protein [Pseudomonas sichuanensis]
MSRTDLLPDAGPVLNIRQALYRAGRDYRGGLTCLALDLGMDLDALQKKLKFNFEARWPTPDELEEIIGATQDHRLLDALLRPAGAVWFRPQPVAATPDALKAVGELLQKEGAFVGSLHSGVADSVWQPHEVALLEHHGNEVIRAVLGIMAGARASMEDRQDG